MILERKPLRSECEGRAREDSKGRLDSGFASSGLPYFLYSLTDPAVDREVQSQQSKHTQPTQTQFADPLSIGLLPEMPSPDPVRD